MVNPNSELRDNPTSDSDNPSLFPKAYLSVSREEFYGQDSNHQPLDLIIKEVRRDLVNQDGIESSTQEFLDSRYWDSYTPNESQQTGPLPDDLHGHIFIIGAAGSFDSEKVDNTDNVWLPAKNGFQSAFSGDGIIYRLDFHTTTFQGQSTDDNNEEKSSLEKIQNSGWAKLATRLIKTPDYYVDYALETNPCYKDWVEFDASRFRDTSLNRLSFALGGRNFLNTAWLPMKSKKDGSERLLVTWDAGRPYEIDPCTLDLVAPVGLNKDWQPMFRATTLSRVLRRIPGLSKVFPILTQVFPLIVATAHPVYDTNDSVVYGVNVTRSLSTIFQIPRLAPLFKSRLLKPLKLLKSSLDEILWIKIILNVVILLSLIILSFGLFAFDLILKLFDVLGVGGQNRLFLFRWYGQQTPIDDINRWEIVDSFRRPINIYQTPHQMALTRDYVIISDSSFKIVLGDLISSIYDPEEFANGISLIRNSIFQLANFIKLTTLTQNIELFRRPADSTSEWLDILFTYLNYPQRPYTDIYIVPRPDRFEPSIPGKIIAKHFCVSPETAHFLTSYDNPDNKVILHAAHIVASDPAEFVHGIDLAICLNELASGQLKVCPETINKELQKRSGILVNGVASNQIGVWIFDLNNNTVEHETVPNNNEEEILNYLPFLGFFTTNENVPEKVTDVFWSCGGDWKNNLTEFYYELHENRIVKEDLDNQIYENLRTGKKSNLLHVIQLVNSNNINLEITDFYEFPNGFYGTSPQFIPLKSSQNESSRGYIISPVFATDNLVTDREQDRKFCELWIFDASNLKQGPIYRLSHPKMNIGPTLHTAWLSKLESPPARNDYDVKDDYQMMLDQVEPQDYRKRIIKLFDNDVYPCLDNKRNCPEERKF